MRAFLVLLFVLVWALPSARALEFSAPGSNAPDEIEIVAPTAQAAPIAFANSRSGASDEASIPIPRAPLSTAKPAAPAPSLAAAPGVSNGAARWILGHATTSAIP